MLKLSQPSSLSLPLGFKNNWRYCIKLLSTQALGDGPLSLYKKKRADNVLAEDTHQEEIVQSLQEVYNDVVNYNRPVIKPKGEGGLFKIFSGDKKEQVIQAPTGLYIYGSVGGGKTMLMDLFYETIPIKEKLRVHFNSFMLNVHSRIHELKIKSGKGAQYFRDDQHFDPIPPVADDITQESWIICFDEFQVTDIGDAMILSRLFTQLFNNGCVVIATSNRQPDDLYKNGLQRSNFLPFIPILKHHCKVIQLDSGIDYRMRGSGKTHSKYFLNSELQSENNGVDTLFKFLVSKENDTVRPRVINILGRNVKFAKACGRILDSTFIELCDRPLGASDYLVISKTFHTVFIREVPRLSIVMQRSQIRRFITLIDTLYDNKVRVVIVADTEPKDLFNLSEKGDIDDAGRTLMDDLNISKEDANANAAIFTGEEEMFATKRCLSRIMEMQSDDYWNKWSKTQ